MMIDHDNQESNTTEEKESTQQSDRTAANDVK